MSFMMLRTQYHFNNTSARTEQKVVSKITTKITQHYLGRMNE